MGAAEYKCHAKHNQENPKEKPGCVACGSPNSEQRQRYGRHQKNNEAVEQISNFHSITYFRRWQAFMDFRSKCSASQASNCA